MSQIGLTTSIAAGLASSALGSSTTAAADRAGRLDAANHSLAAGQQSLSTHPLDRDANTSADRDADGWTGGGSATSEETDVPPETQSPAEQKEPPTRLRLPDDPCGGSLDVTV